MFSALDSRSNNAGSTSLLMWSIKFETVYNVLRQVGQPCVTMLPVSVFTGNVSGMSGIIGSRGEAQPYIESS